MTKQERLIVKGLIAEKKQRLLELGSKMEGYGIVIHNALPTYLDIKAYNTQLVLECAECLHKARQEYDKLEAELQKLQAEWG